MITDRHYQKMQVQNDNDAMVTGRVRRWACGTEEKLKFRTSSRRGIKEFFFWACVDRHEEPDAGRRTDWRRQAYVSPKAQHSPK